MSRSQRVVSAPLFFILFLASWLFFFGLGDRSFRNPDEGRYAEIAREMVLGGDWAKPVLYGIDYLRKPPLFYWLVAASFKIFGLSEFSARAVPAVFGVLGVLATFFFALKVFDAETAFFSSLLLCSNIWYLEVGRYLLIDMVFSFFLVSSLYLFYLGIAENKNKTLYYLSFYFFLALAFLTKGLAALAIAGPAILFYLVVAKKLKQTLSEMQLASGALIFLAITLPWIIHMALIKPGFLNFFFLHEHLERFISSNFEHQEPWFYYLAALPLVFLPWILFVKPLQNAFSFLKVKNEDSPKLFIFVSACTVVLFYSLSRSKLPTYILPSLPLFALLIAGGWKELKAPHRLFNLPAAVLLFIGIMAVMGAPAFFSRLEEKIPDEVIPQIQILGGVLIAGSILCFRAIRREHSKQLFYVLAAMGIGVSMMVSIAMETLNASYTTKSFAQTLKEHLHKEDAVFIYDHPGPFYDFAFYLDHPVTLVGLEGEFELSRKDPQALAAAMPKEKFISLLNERQKFFCILRKSDFTDLGEGIRKNLHILKQDDRKVLFESGAAG